MRKKVNPEQMKERPTFADGQREEQQEVSEEQKRPGFLRQPRNVEGVRWEPVRGVGFWPRNNGKSLKIIRGT